MTMLAPLASAEVVREVERAASAHLGRPWASQGFTDRSDRSSHPCGIHHGQPFSVFVKLSTAPDGREQFLAELGGLNLIRRLAQVAAPVPVGSGIGSIEAGQLLLIEALPERPAGSRTPTDYRAIGHALALLHRVDDAQFGLGQPDGFFGPLPQDNRPVRSNRWADFYAERRLA